MFAIDYETHLISDEMPIPKPVCLSWAEKGKSGLVVGMKAMEQLLRDAFEDDKAILAHNATFELLVTHVWFPSLRPLLWEHVERGGFICTQLYQQLIDNVSKKEHHDKSLAGLVKLYFKVDISESKKDPTAWRLRYSELDGVPLDQWPEEAKKYAIDDSIWALDVYKKQVEKHRGIEQGSHIRASFILNLIASRGFLVDPERVNILDQELDNVLNPIYKDLEDLGFMNRNKKTNKLSKNVKKLKEYVEENFTNMVLSPKGGISVAGEALDSYLLEKDDDILAKFRYLGVYEKTKTAFVSRLKKANPLLRTSYNAIVRSGRTSSRASSIYPSVNIQQMPKALKGVTWDVRECLVARPGYRLVAIDFNNLELISVAYQLYREYGKSAMMDIINSGDKPTDLHSVFASRLMSKSTGKHIAYEDFVAKKKEPEFKAYRNKGKPISLGLPGGMGYDTIRIQCNKEGIPLQYKILAKSEYEVVVRRLMRKYEGEFPNIRVKQTGHREWSLVLDEIVGLKKILFELYPELERFLKEGHKKYLTGEVKWVKDEWGKWEEDPFYRYDFKGVKRDFCNYTATCNGFLMQSPSAGGAKNCGWLLAKEFEYTDNDEVYMMAFIHDEYIFEIKDNENFRKNVDRCAEIMIDGMQEVLPGIRIAVEAEINDYWSKTRNEYAIGYFKNANDKTLRVL